MTSTRRAPSREQYEELQRAYEHFNRTLFDGELPECMITLQREKRTCGYFSAARWASGEGDTTDEIALNPVYFAVVPLVETMQTLVHEMTHLWQHHFGDPGRKRYHNLQWATKMESIGLMPSVTGKPGGARTGEQMADYAIPGGRFLAACGDLVSSNLQIWYDRFPSTEHVEVGAASHGVSLPPTVGGGRAPRDTLLALASVVEVQGPAPGAGSSPRQSDEAEPADAPIPPEKSGRVTRICPTCRGKAWSRPKLPLICGDCKVLMQVAGARPKRGPRGQELQ